MAIPPEPAPIAWSGSEEFIISGISYVITDQPQAASLKMQKELIKALEKLAQKLK